jgi:hypothetical protein
VPFEDLHIPLRPEAKLLLTSTQAPGRSADALVEVDQLMHQLIDLHASAPLLKRFTHPMCFTRHASFAIATAFFAWFLARLIIARKGFDVGCCMDAITAASLLSSKGWSVVAASAYHPGSRRFRFSRPA